MHVKTLGYPIGCQPEIYNEDYHSLRFFIKAMSQQTVDK